MIFKTKKGNIVYFTVLVLVGLLWALVYNHTNEYTMYRFNADGGVDTTKVYKVAPRFTKKVVVDGDTLYLYFNKKREAVVKIRKDSLKHYMIKK